MGIFFCLFTTTKSQANKNLPQLLLVRFRLCKCQKISFQFSNVTRIYDKLRGPTSSSCKKSQKFKSKKIQKNTKKNSKIQELSKIKKSKIMKSLEKSQKNFKKSKTIQNYKNSKIRKVKKKSNKILFFNP